MNKTTCSNCGASEFYSKEASFFGGEMSGLLPVSFFSSKQALVRVCGNCGLIQWFAAPQTLEKVKQSFSRES